MPRLSLEVPRHARCELSRELAADVREVWLVLHGYGQLASEFIALFEGLATPARLIVAPEALSRFYADEATGRVGASWMTKEERACEMDDYVRYLDAVAERVRAGLAGADARWTVLGFSQGASTAWRWVARGTAPLERLVAWGGDCPPDVELAAGSERFGALRIELVTGREDGWMTPAKLELDAERLRVAGLEHRLRLFDGGHRLDRALLAEIATE